MLEETEIATFRGLMKNQLVWTYESVQFPTTFRLKTLDKFGLPQKGEFFTAAFPDNEGILFVTSNWDTMSTYDILTIHRIYKSNWFFVGNFLIPRVSIKYQTRKRSKIIVHSIQLDKFKILKKIHCFRFYAEWESLRRKKNL